MYYKERSDFMSKLTTKKAIGYAFKELLLEKPFNKISVNDITDKCGINRQTFYYHFCDIRDLVEWICVEDAENALKDNRTYKNWVDGFLAIFDLLKKDRIFVLNIYKNAHRDLLENYLHKVTYDLLLNVVNEKAVNYLVREDDKEAIANFYKFGFVGIVLEWVENDMRQDATEIVNQLRYLIHGTLDTALANADKRNK